MERWVFWRFEMLWYFWYFSHIRRFILFLHFVQLQEGDLERVKELCSGLGEEARDLNEVISCIFIDLHVSFV